MGSVMAKKGLLSCLVLATFILSPHCVAETLKDAHRAYEKKEFSRAMKIALSLAQQGIANAEYLVGAMYLEGEGVENDFGKAFTWFSKAAEHGDADGQVALARMYRNGLGTQRDFPQALRWFGEAANSGSSEGAFEMANMFFSGEGTPQNYSEAVRWFKVSADRRHALASFHLGVLYAEGKGVEKDLESAFFYLSNAHRLGVTKASKPLAEVQSQMTHRQIERSKVRLQSTRTN